MIISKNYMHEYVCCLPCNLENDIMEKVTKHINGLWLSDMEKETAINYARSSKVCDLTDTIDIIFE